MRRLHRELCRPRRAEAACTPTGLAAMRIALYSVHLHSAQAVIETVGPRSAVQTTILDMNLDDGSCEVSPIQFQIYFVRLVTTLINKKLGLA